MSDFSKAFEQWAFDSRYPVSPEEPAPAAEKPQPEGSRARAQANAPTAGDAAMGLADLLAGALKGSVAQALGIGGDVRELVNLVAEDTANKVLGERRLMTTEEVQKWLPQVVKNGDPAREHSAAVGEKIGEFLPVAPIGVVKGALKLAKSAPKTAGAATAGVAGGATAGDAEAGPISVAGKTAKRGYSAVSDALMGFKKQGPHTTSADNKFKHYEFVQGKTSSGEVFYDAIPGMNKEHAMERARRNWRDGVDLKFISRDQAMKADPDLVKEVDTELNGKILRYDSKGNRK